MQKIFNGEKRILKRCLKDLTSICKRKKKNLIKN